MDDKFSTSLILLTYKGKALLMYRTNSAIDSQQHEWCFIGGEKNDDESFEEAMARRVTMEASIKIEQVEYLSKSCYHARLTDDNVNNIKRDERQLLDFFTLREVQKLPLSEATKLFIEKHGALI
ncbi:MAG: NUDIX hydrolase [Candidatus Levybacteria bacterium]|nr:NUDIX hydrolase [Candidatus Levybacteria bacterium]